MITTNRTVNTSVASGTLSMNLIQPAGDGDLGLTSVSVVSTATARSLLTRDATWEGRTP